MKKIFLVAVLLGSVGAAYAFENHWSEDWSMSSRTHHENNGGHGGHKHCSHDNWLF